MTGTLWLLTVADVCRRLRRCTLSCGRGYPYQNHFPGQICAGSQVNFLSLKRSVRRLHLVSAKNRSSAVGEAEERDWGPAPGRVGDEDGDAPRPWALSDPVSYRQRTHRRSLPALLRQTTSGCRP